MNVHPVVGREGSWGANQQKMLGKWLLDGARAYLVTACLSASTMAALCPHVLNAPQDVPVSVLGCDPSAPAQVKPAQSLKITPRPQGVPGFHDLPSLVLLGCVEIPLWLLILLLVRVSSLYARNCESFVGGGLSFSMMISLLQCRFSSLGLSGPIKPFTKMFVKCLVVPYPYLPLYLPLTPTKMFCMELEIF